MSVYYGEIKCVAKYANGIPCRNMAYYQHGNNYLCGLHSKKFVKRKCLPYNPNKQRNLQIKLKEQQDSIEMHAVNNRKNGKKGDVICCKIKMMKAVDDIDGYVKVFPNYKHGNRKDGLGMSALSPKAMGPIDHGQPGLPIAKNLENFHQGNKCFPSELNENGRPNDEYYATRLNMYNDDVPHRHKEAANGKNKPAFSIWVNKEGKELKMSYIDSRQFYCNYYERIAIQLPEFKRLKELIKNGYNLQICGYDAYSVTEALEKHYLDDSRPFGHELVLYTLLVTENSNDYPWRKYKTQDF